MSLDEIETILIIVQFKDGAAHQVLTTSENKKNGCFNDYRC